METQHSRTSLPVNRLLKLLLIEKLQNQEHQLPAQRRHSYACVTGSKQEIRTLIPIPIHAPACGNKEDIKMDRIQRRNSTKLVSPDKKPPRVEFQVSQCIEGAERTRESSRVWSSTGGAKKEITRRSACASLSSMRFAGTLVTPHPLSQSHPPKR